MINKIIRSNKSELKIYSNAQVSEGVKVGSQSLSILSIGQ